MSMSSPDTGVKAPEVRNRILDVAAEAFMAQGFASTTLDDLAERVGATKGLIYYHFRSKFDVFLAVYEEGMRRVREHVEPHATSGGSGRDRLAAMSRAHVLNLMTDLAYHHAVHQGVRAQESAELKIRQRDALAALNELRRDYEHMFRRVVAEGMTDGSLRELDESLATRVLLSNLNAVDTWYRKREDQPAKEVEELADRIVDLLIGGLAPSPGEHGTETANEPGRLRR